MPGPHMSRYFSLLFLVFFACSGLEQSEYERIRRQNAVAEFVKRQSDDQTLFPTVLHRERELYPWEELYVGNEVKITKEFFRCKGNVLNPARRIADNVHCDCQGPEKHTLPIVEGREFIYPILIDLLNYIQEKTKKKVVITCGHRCPLHNTYADDSPQNAASKHMIGAEVDFYVKGLEHQPEKVVDLVMSYYRGRGELGTFSRYEQPINVRIKPWYNKEILIKLYQKDEGRDLDNRHPYPYIGIQVRYDLAKREPVTFTYEKAQKGYQRY
jgi:hypothetical protein